MEAKGITIEKTNPYVIVCEGVEDKVFIEKFLEYMEAQNTKFSKFTVLPCEGKHNLPKFIKRLPIAVSGFSQNAKSLTILRDVDTDSSPSQSVQKILENAKFTAPKVPCEVAISSSDSGKIFKVSYGFFPEISNENHGALEDLCLHILKDANSSCMQIASNAVEAVSTQIGKLKRPHKNRIHAYFSLTDNLVGQGIRTVAQNGGFDFSAIALKPLADMFAEIIDSDT